jgi:hypothetical protein
MLRHPRRIAKQLNRWWSRRQLERLGLLEWIRDYPEDAIPPKYDELYGLYRLARQRRPEIILELGGGYSSFALAKACFDLQAAGHPARLYSVDASEYWQGVVKARLPGHLLPYVSFHRSDVTGEVRGFSSVPVERANLVFVDGGGYTVPVRLEDTAPDDYAILVDGRRGTVEYLEAHLRGDYAVTTWLGSQTLFIRRGNSR